MGILTGVLGFLSTLAALNTFADTCFRELSSSNGNIDIDKQPGSAFILLLIATILKAFDIWAHCIVPVPEQDYWSPDGNNSTTQDMDDSNSKNRQLMDPSQAKSNSQV